MNRYIKLKLEITGRLQLLALYLQGHYKHKPFVSLCTPIKDRLEHIKQTFIKNIEDSESYPNCEFVLLNYNCPDPRTDEWAKTVLKPYIDAGKVNYYYYPEVEFFSQSHSRNLLFRLAQGEIVCNVDADNFIGEGFIDYTAAALHNGNTVLVGPSASGATGRICVKKEHWEKVGGYDEHFKGWGAEDRDFTNRLAMIGLKKKHIRLLDRFCQAIPHDNELRHQHTEEKKHVSWDRNKKLARENIEKGIINPNGPNFGHGRVLKNFTEWLEV